MAVFNTDSSILDDEDRRRLFDAVLTRAAVSTARGSYFGTYSAVLSRVDRFGVNPAIANHEVSGLTFITRPKLCLVSPNLRQDNAMATLDIINEWSLPFAIRCYLDTKFSGLDYVMGPAANSAFFNSESPFILPLTNMLTSISGPPDFMIDTETTDPGYFGESQTFARGSDMGARNYDFTLNFRDIQGGFVFSLFYCWIRYIAAVTRGIMVAYPEDIEARRLCYTCSIYRFVMDPSRRFITKWMKATGCFPKSVPTGNMFTIGARESWLAASNQLDIPFAVNVVEVQNPQIFADFNTIVTRFSPAVAEHDRSWRQSGRPTMVVASNDATTNFRGLPYIDTRSGFNELQFLCRPEELANPVASIVSELTAKIAAARPALTRAPGA